LYSIREDDVGLDYNEWHDKNHLMKGKLDDIGDKGISLIDSLLSAK
jgi:hypothetical protein